MREMTLGATLTTLLMVMLSLGTATPAKAQQRFKFTDSLGTYTVKFQPHKSGLAPAIRERHDLRLSTSYGPRTGNGWTPGDGFIYDNHNGYPIEYAHESWVSLSGEYSSRLNEWLSIGCVATWTGGFQRCDLRNTSQRLGTRTANTLTAMAIVRMAWLRRGIVQLYSAAGIGLGVTLNKSYDNRRSSRLFGPYDITFIGISVGREWYAFFDISASSRGILNVGVGYRFNKSGDKK